MFKLAENHELITTIPLKLKRHRPKLKKVKKPAYPPDVIRRIVLAADPQYRAVFWTYALTGLRGGEVPALQWGDIDFDAGLIHVRRKLWRGVLKTSRLMPAMPRSGYRRSWLMSWPIIRRQADGLLRVILYSSCRTVAHTRKNT